MKPYKLLFLFIIIFSFSHKIHAQEVILYSGSPDILKGQTNINVEFVYDGMKVGEFTEDIYLKQKKSEFRKAADGDKFIKKWNSDRKDIYEVKFMEKLNKGLKKINIVAEKNTPAHTYTMLVQTIRLEPGFFNGTSGMKRDTYVDLLIKIVESENHDNVLCVFKAERIVGVTDDLNQMKETTLKITNAYDLAAEKISKLIVKICTQKEKVKDVPEDEVKHDKKEKKDKKSKKDEEDKEE